MSEETTLSDDLQFDTSNLYREETFTDLRVGTIQKLTPMLPDGTEDMTRPPKFVAQTQIMTQMGPLPVQAAIDAPSLKEAIDQFPAALNEALERMIEEAQTRQREEASRIVTPGEMMKQNSMLRPNGGGFQV